MEYPPIFFDPYFVQNVIGGYLLVLVGAVLLLAAAVWWSSAREWLHTGPKPLAFRALSAVGFLCFIAGILWQLVGYVRVGAVTW